jgi:hypothetical protein
MVGRKAWKGTESLAEVVSISIYKLGRRWRLQVIRADGLGECVTHDSFLDALNAATALDGVPREPLAVGSLG